MTNLTTLLLTALLLAACGGADTPAPAMCTCAKPVGVNAVQTYSCACDSDEYRRFGK